MRHLLLASASRMVYAPENDEGFEDHDEQDGQVADPDEDVDDEVDGDEAGGAVDREADDDDGDDEGDDDRPAQVADRSSRGSNRIATLASERAAEKARADALERELAGIRQDRQRQEAQAQQAQEAERLALMDPDERASYQIQQAERRMDQKLAQIQFQSADSADKTAFEAICNRNPAAAGLKDEVETALQTMRAQGTTAPRETVLKYLLGEKALAKQPRAKTAGSKAAAAGRDRQQVRASSARGDVANTGTRRGSEADQRRRRLENVEL